MSTRVACLGLALVLAAGVAGAEFRFPMPEFETDYEHPEVQRPAPNLDNGLLDTAVLFGALVLAAWLVLKRRSRAGVFALTIFAVLYFGFWRKGCVCAVGSVQNMVAGVTDPGFEVPWVVLAFFLLPLVFSLFFGRVFCAAVCPLGAAQELVAIRPVQVPRTIEHVLGLIPYAYLGLTVLAVATGSGFLICRYDPFVGFFRLGASFNLLLLGGVFLVAGVFIGRPYCRYLCPYGVLLGWMSFFSKWRASITPTTCVQCRLCEDSCPYNAINPPTPETVPTDRRTGARRLGWMLLAAPLIIGFAAWVGMQMHEVLARLHPTVQLAERVTAEDRGEGEEMTLESEAFYSSNKTREQLYSEARDVRAQFRAGSAWLGAFLGLVIVGKLVSLSLVRRRTDYETDRTACVACARCFKYCPVEGTEESEAEAG